MTTSVEILAGGDIGLASEGVVMLRARDLFCERDERVLFESLNFDVREGQILQIKGSNGSGKTTLLRILCGLNGAYKGAIHWYQERIEEQVKMFHSSLLFIGHRVGVNKALTPVENLRWSCGLQQQVAVDDLYKALQEVGLHGFEESQCFTLSAGQQQRVSLARLLISTAKLWVLDEPFTTLDSRGVKQLEELLGNHANSGGAVIVTTHHNLQVAGVKELTLV